MSGSTTTSTGSHQARHDQPNGQAAQPQGSRPLLFDLSHIDLSKRLLSRQDLERWNPHRGHMALVDWVIWTRADFKQAVGLKHTRPDEFWASGHFPGRPMFPGVLMIESAAQLAVYCYNARLDKPKLAAFTRIENASFRAAVVPGDDLLLLCQEVKWSRRGFTCDTQGIVGNRTAFEARIHGVAIGE